MKTRRSSRVRTAVHGSVKSARGFQWDIEIADLSQGGCRIDEPHRGLELGRHVKLFIAGTGPHLAEVVWRQGDRVGLEFLRPLSQRVLTLLAHGHLDEAREACDQEDALGRATRFAVRRVL